MAEPHHAHQHCGIYRPGNVHIVPTVSIAQERPNWFNYFHGGLSHLDPHNPFRFGCLGVPGSRGIGPATEDRLFHCQSTIWPELLFRWGIHEQTTLDQRIEATEVEQEAQVNGPESFIFHYA